MSNQSDVFKLNSKFKKLPPSKLDIDYFARLYNILSELNQEACEYQKNQLSSEHFEDKDQYNQVLKKLDYNYKVLVNVKGKNGENFTSVDGNLFKQDLPSSIKRITINNNQLYNHELGNNPTNWFELIFDFNKSEISNFTSSPSEATYNESSLIVEGQNKTWVQGCYERVLGSLEDSKTSRKFLHSRNIYDLILWFFFIPLSFLNLNYFVDRYSKSIENLSAVFTVALYIYFFIVLLILFRIFFNYSRWLFPYTELTSNSNNKSLTQRSIWGLIGLGILGNVISQIIYSFF